MIKCKLRKLEKMPENGFTCVAKISDLQIRHTLPWPNGLRRQTFTNRLVKIRGGVRGPKKFFFLFFTFFDSLECTFQLKLYHIQN